MLDQRSDCDRRLRRERELALAEVQATSEDKCGASHPAHGNRHKVKELIRRRRAHSERLRRERPLLGGGLGCTDERNAADAAILGKPERRLGNVGEGGEQPQLDIDRTAGREYEHRRTPDSGDERARGQTVNPVRRHEGGVLHEQLHLLRGPGALEPGGRDRLAEEHRVCAVRRSRRHRGRGTGSYACSRDRGVVDAVLAEYERESVHRRGCRVLCRS